MNTREELTRQAEKCLRQGRLDEAITLYQHLADLPPTDWGVVKLLADMLERAGQREAASAQFARWADYLFAEGFHSKAAALYKKVLKLEPLHEHALWQLGEVSIALKLRADARVAFGRVAELRQRRNDSAGAEAARRRLEMLDVGVAAAAPVATPWTPVPAADVVAPVAQAAAMASRTASEPPRPLAVLDTGPAPQPTAVAALTPTPPPATAPPDPAPPSEALLSPMERLARLRDDAMRAEVMLAPDARERWLAVLDADPGDVTTRLRLVRRALERGDRVEAGRLASPLDAGDAAALVVLMEVADAGGRPDGLQGLIRDRVRAGATVADLTGPIEVLSRRNRGAARAACAAAATAWHHGGRPAQASALLARADALGVLDAGLALQWVETCVETNLPELSHAQAALVEAYLASGRTGDARAFAEDLFVREAGAASADTVLRRVLEREGVSDADAVLAGLLAPPAVSQPATAVSTTPDDEPAWSELRLDDEPSAEPYTEPEAPAPAPEPAPEPEFEAKPEFDVAAPSDDAWRAAPGALAAAAPQAPVESADFDWADLLGRDLGFGFDVDEPLLAASLSDAQAVDDASAEADEPAPPVEDVATMQPVDLAPEIAVAAAVPMDPEPSPVDDSIGDMATMEAVEDAPVATDVVAEPPAAEPVAVPEPRVSLLATIEALHAQPTLEGGDDQALPVLSTPRAWLSGPSGAVEGDTRARHDDDYLFEDAAPARWAMRRPAIASPPAWQAVAEPLAELPRAPEPTPGPEPDAVDLGAYEFQAASEADAFVEALATPEPAIDVAVDEVSVTDESCSDADAAPPVFEATGVVDEEIDLTLLLEELKQWDPVLPEPVRRTLAVEPALPAPPEATAAAPAEEPERPPVDQPAAPAGDEAAAGLEAIFAGFQREADGRVVAEQQLAAGRVFLAAGLISEAARAFERASSEPRTRFEAAQALAGVHHSRGQLPEAVRWFEQAAEAPVPDAAVKRAVLYDLAESLEALGESDRALGVLLDLLSQVEDYRDARVRLDRLLRVDAGG